MDDSNYFLYTDIVQDEENIVEINLEKNKNLFEKYSNILKTSKEIKLENITNEEFMMKENISKYHKINSKKNILHQEL